MILKLGRSARPCTQRKPPLTCGVVGVSDGARTRDNRDHNPVLYQLSYTHHGAGESIPGRRDRDEVPRKGQGSRARTCRPAAALRLEAVVPNPVACVNCGRERPMELQMSAKNGQVLTMVSCPKCETRSWYADGTAVTMDEVLKITANDPEFVVMPSTGKQRSRRQ